MKIKTITAIGRRPVYDITVKDVHHYVLGNGVVTHNTAVTYSSNSVWYISKSQEKIGTDLAGWNFNISIAKSRYHREKSKFSLQVMYEGGIKKYSGIMDLALESGDLAKPSNGWYQLVDNTTGEMVGTKTRAADLDPLLAQIVKRDSFKKFVKDKYQLNEPMGFDSVEETFSEEDL